MPSAIARPKDFDWKDSNVALVGSKEDKDTRKASALKEKAWAGVTEINETKVIVWRVNQFELELVPESEHGIFYGGDSYIVMKITANPNGTPTRHIHFWIGSESTADEYGTAAYKTVELDALMDDSAIQHREVQDFESELFHSYFQAVEILNGGHKTGFRHVEPNQYQPRLLLFSITGRGFPTVQEVTFSRKSLNSDDVFVLDLGTKAIQWNGSKSNAREKIAAGTFLQKLENQRAGKCMGETIDESDSRAHASFIEQLPDKELAAVKDIACHNHVDKAIFKVSDANGQLEFSEVCTGSAKREMVTEDDAFLIDGSQGLFVYVGSKCSPQEKGSIMAVAHSFLKKSNHPLAPITVLKSGQQDAEFDAVFAA